MILRTSSLLLLAAILGGCDLFAEPEPFAAAAVEVVSGDEQVGPVGTELPQPLVARVLDGDGQPLEGIVVTWGGPGGGSVSAVADTTDAGGLVSTRWTLGDTPGEEIMRASTGLVSATFTAEAVAN